jgi:transposase
VLVDVLGCLLAVLILAADVSDRDGAALLLAMYYARYPELKKIWGDSHYGGDLGQEMQAKYGIDVEPVVKPTDQPGFVPLPRRWVVERSIAWIVRARRLGHDYEHDPSYSEAWIHLATIHRLVKYLALDPTLPVPYQDRAKAA